MAIRLSHTQVSKYLECPRKWKHHYIDRIRPDGLGSALFLGIALDEAFNRLLLDKKEYFKNDEHFDLYFTAEQIFDFTFRKMNGQDLPKNINCQYFKSDLSLELLTPSDLLQIEQYAEELGYDEFFKITDLVNHVYDKKMQVPADDVKIFNFINWLSLRRKGLLLVDVYRKNIMPQIAKVTEIQKNINMVNPVTKDSYIGKIDWMGYFVGDDKEYVVDNKSSSKPFKLADVQGHNQLSGYCEAENNMNACIVYVEKKLRKRVPITREGIVKTTMPEETVEETFNNIEKTLDGIKNKDYNRIVETKEEARRACNFYGRKCEYYDLCWGGKCKEI